MTSYFYLKVIDLKLLILFEVGTFLYYIFFWLNILWDYRFNPPFFLSLGIKFYLSGLSSNTKSIDGLLMTLIDILIE